MHYEGLLYERRYCCRANLAVYTTAVYVDAKTLAFLVHSVVSTARLVGGLVYMCSEPGRQGGVMKGVIGSCASQSCLCWLAMSSCIFCQESTCLTVGLPAMASCGLRLWRPEMSAMCLHERRRVIRSALCLKICCSMGKRYASISSAALEVALNAPQILLAALACMLCRMLSVFFVYVLPLVPAFDQIEHASSPEGERRLRTVSACLQT
jgi:hypothetical protein